MRSELHPGRRTARHESRVLYISVVLLTAVSLLGTGCSSKCRTEVVAEVHSPDEKYTAVVSLEDCGGATTNFFGYVDVLNTDGEIVAEHIIGFDGRFDSALFSIQWASPNKIIFDIDSLEKIRRLNPDGRKTNALTVDYRFVGYGQTL